MTENMVDLSCNGQPYAHSIETILRRWINCDRVGLLGVIDADVIRRNPELSIKCAMSYLYSRAELEGNYELINKINDYINKYSFYIEFPIDTLLSFKSGENPHNGYTCELSMDGKDAVDLYISALDEIK